MSLELAITHKLTLQQEAFADAIADGCEMGEAATRAGYQDPTPSREAWRLLQQPHIMAAVQIKAMRQLALATPASLKLLRRFVDEDKWDAKVRLAAANSLLNRAGVIAPKAVAPGKAGETPLNEMSMADLRQLADKLEHEIAGRAKDVSSAKAAPRATQSIDDII